MDAFPSLTDTTPEGIIAWIKDVTRIREGDVSGTDEQNRTIQANAAADVDLTTGVTGILPVPNGGTGVATNTAHGLLRGNGANAVDTIAPGSALNVLTSDGTDWASTAPAAPTSGTVIHKSITSYNSNTTLNTALPIDDTIPTSSEGAEIISQANTAFSATTKVRLRFQGTLAAANVINGVVLLIDGTAVQATLVDPGSVNLPNVATFEYIHTPGDTSSHTYSVRAGNAGGSTLRFNGTTSARVFGGILAATLTIDEIRP